MNRRAVFILLFLILAVIGLEPFITNGFILNKDISFYGGLEDSLALVNKTLLASYSGKIVKREIIEVPLTAYSSSVDETDDTPFITASGNYVRHGVTAANFLPFGTKFRIPELFGDRVFVVEDRMHRSYNYRIDIWFPSKEEAIKFGYQVAEVEIF